MDLICAAFMSAYNQGSGPSLGQIFCNSEIQNSLEWRTTPNRESLASYFRQRCFDNIVPKPSKKELTGWNDLLISYVKTVTIRSTGLGVDRQQLYQSWREVANNLIKGYTACDFQAWTIPCIYVICRMLRESAIQADVQNFGKPRDMDVFAEDLSLGVSANENLEDAARVINRVFSICCNDRSTIDQSRKWAVYYVANILFKIYFKLKSVNLAKNIIRALNVSIQEMPGPEAFPKSHITTYEYYLGILAFLEERYAEADGHLEEALRLCHRNAIKNRELILTYLVPCRLLTKQTLPSKKLLALYPNLRGLFAPYIHSIKVGDIGAFDRALETEEDRFVRRRIYLTLERGRDLALRNLFRKVYLAGGYDKDAQGQNTIRRTRIPVSEFVAAVNLRSNPDSGLVERDEIECMLANLIFKNMIKGYIAKGPGIVVLSKTGAFPPTGT